MTSFSVIVDAYDCCRILVIAVIVDESFIQMTIGLISPTNLDFDEERMGWSMWHLSLGTNFFGKVRQLPIFWKIWSPVANVDFYVSHCIVVRELCWPMQGWHISSHSLVFVAVLSSMHEWCFDTCLVILLSFVGCAFKIVQSFLSDAHMSTFKVSQQYTIYQI